MWTIMILAACRKPLDRALFSILLTVKIGQNVASHTMSGSDSQFRPEYSRSRSISGAP